MSRLCLAMVKGRRAGLEMAENTKPKRSRTKTAVKHGPHKCSSSSTYHSFLDAADVDLLRSQLLSWYDKEKRELPWRTTAMTEPDINIRTYAVPVRSLDSPSHLNDMRWTADDQPVLSITGNSFKTVGNHFSDITLRYKETRRRKQEGPLGNGSPSTPSGRSKLNGSSETLRQRKS